MILKKGVHHLKMKRRGMVNQLKVRNTTNKAETNVTKQDKQNLFKKIRTKK